MSNRNNYDTCYVLEDLVRLKVACDNNDDVLFESIINNSKDPYDLLNEEYTLYPTGPHSLLKIVVRNNCLKCVKTVMCHKLFNGDFLNYSHRKDCNILNFALDHDYLDIVEFILKQNVLHVEVVYDCINQYGLYHIEKLKGLLENERLDLMSYKMGDAPLKPHDTLLSIFSHEHKLQTSIEIECFEIILEQTFARLPNEDFENVFYILIGLSPNSIAINRDYIFTRFYTHENSKYDLILKAFEMTPLEKDPEYRNLHSFFLILHDKFNANGKIKTLTELFFRYLDVSFNKIVTTIIADRNETILSFICDILRLPKLEYADEILYPLHFMTKYKRNTLDAEQINMIKILCICLLELNYPFDFFIINLNKEYKKKPNDDILFVIELMLPFSTCYCQNEWHLMFRDREHSENDHIEDKTKTISLQALCRLKIRNLLYIHSGQSAKGLVNGIMSLEYPILLKKYLRFDSH